MSCQICNRITLSVCLSVCLSVSFRAEYTDSAVYFLAWQLKNLPVYTLAAKVCPPGTRIQNRHPARSGNLMQNNYARLLTGVEASLTACIAGMNDLSGAVAQYFGAWLTTLCGVTSVDFERVWVIYLVRTACKLIPIPLVLLVPSVSLTCACLTTQITAAL